MDDSQVSHLSHWVVSSTIYRADMGEKERNKEEFGFGSGEFVLTGRHSATGVQVTTAYASLEFRTQPRGGNLTC